MKKYLVRFITKEGEYDKEWCHARNKKEAKETMMREHWNIDHITDVEEL